MVEQPDRCLVFALDEGYLAPTLVAIRSALLHSDPDVDVVVGAVGLDATGVRRIEAVCAGSGRHVEVHDATHLTVGLPRGLPRLPPAAWARVFMESFVSSRYERLLYLDGDTYVRSPLGPLFSSGLDGLPLGAVVDPSEPDHRSRGEDFWGAAQTPPSAAYFNSGVMLVDFPVWLTRQVARRVSELARNPHLPMRSVDQDALNVVLCDDWMALPATWNTLGNRVTRHPERASIVHFEGTAKPWRVRSPVPLFQTEYEELARSLGWNIDPADTKVG